MDPRTGWCTPEQICPAIEHWLRLWESSLQQEQGDTIMIQESSHKGKLQKQQDFIPLDYKPVDQVYQRNSLNHKSDSHRKDGNRASTYGLNHSSNLDILRRNKLVPWMREDQHYEQYHYVMW